MEIDDGGGFMYVDYSASEMAKAIEHLIAHPEGAHGDGLGLISYTRRPHLDGKGKRDIP